MPSSDKHPLVIGDDTPLGRAVANALRALGMTVACVDSRSPIAIPDDCQQLLCCHTISDDAPAQHLRCIQALCDALLERPADALRLHVAYPVTANAFEATGTQLKDDAPLTPHCRREMVAAQAIMQLKATAYLSRTKVVPNFFRHGELYGDTALPLPGHLACCLRLAASHRPLPLPGMGMRRLTLVHLDDLARAIAALCAVSDDAPIPESLNIPGEAMSVIDYMGAIADHYGLDLASDENPYSDDYPWGIGDRILSPRLFKAALPDFKRTHSFRRWLESQPR